MILNSEIRMRLCGALGAVAIACLAVPPACAQAPSDSVMMAVTKAAAGCKVLSVRRIGDTAFVVLLDSMITPEQLRSNWTVCGGKETEDGARREIVRAIVQPLWSAWPPPAITVEAVVYICGKHFDRDWTRHGFYAPGYLPPDVPVSSKPPVSRCNPFEGR